MTQRKKYYAFISYKREDEKWAKWLQDKLEHYKFPTNLNGRTDLPKNIRPTFRDVTDINPGLLAEEINNALTNSEWLIVICSPRSAKSPWVCKEAQTFIDLNRTDHIIPFVIEGTPFSSDPSTECYPEALLYLTGSKEILAANINEMGRDSAAIKVVARMFNLQFDSLWQRHEREKRRRRIWIFTAVIIFAIVLLVVAGRFRWLNNNLKIAITEAIVAKNTAEEERKRAEEERGKANEERSRAERAEDSIRHQNQLLNIERNNVLRANIHLNLSIMKTYLSQSRPEMALVVLNDIESNYRLLDPQQIKDLLRMKESLCDSILTNSTLLVNISSTEKPKSLYPTILLNNTEIASIHHIDNIDVLYIRNNESNNTDTIKGDPELNIITNYGITHIAIYEAGNPESDGLDTVYTHGKSGIKVYSLQTGKMERFVGCWGWFSFTTYPMALSNNGTYLIYHEGYRAFDRTWFVNFDNGQQIPLNTSYSNSTDYAISSFSPNDKWFYLYYPKKKNIEVYSRQSLKKIHTFRYDEYDSVYWDASNNICISSRGKVYSWRLVDYKTNYTFSIGTYANNVNISRKYAAAACDDGKIYIWDIRLGRMIYAKEIIAAPMDVAFAHDEEQLWVISGYNQIKTINLKNLKVKDVYPEDEDATIPPHPWPTYLYTTKNGSYFISFNTYENKYTLYDTKGSMIRTKLEDYIKNQPEDIFSEFVLPEIFDYDLENPELTNSQSPVLTARRLSSNGNMCIEGYSNGSIKVFSTQEKNTLNSLIKKEDRH